MKGKLFVSSDIEGTCGIAHWDEAGKDKPDYAAFSGQMSREVAAACAGALAGGMEDVLVRDAHSTARNIQPELLPEDARIFRGWGRDPYAMMSGVDDSFSGVMFTGYHSAASWNGNPLSHTMNLRNNFIRLNGDIMSELMMNSLTATMFGLPVLMVTGDRMLCEWFRTVCPGTLTVPVNEGLGNGSISLQPGKAVRLIRETAEQAVRTDCNGRLYPMPEHFTVEVNYVKHFDARSAGFYPGAKQTDSKTAVYESDNWLDVLTFFHFCL